MDTRIDIVFDFDGTLVDTQKYHAQIESDFLKELGVTISSTEITSTYAGRTPRERLKELLEQHGHSVDQTLLDNFEHQKNQKIIELAMQKQITLLHGVQEFLAACSQEQNIHMGISSGASQEALEKLIPFFGIPIIHFTSADEVVNKKPAPDVFLKTFEKMEAPATAHKVVIGDGVSDILGGQASGAKTIFVNTQKEKGEKNGADIVIESFVNLSIRDIYNLWNI